MLNKTAIAAVTVLSLWASSATASVFQVSVWTGPNDGIDSSNVADIAHMPSTPADAQFTFTTAIDGFNGSASTPTNAQFFSGGAISGFSSPEHVFTNDPAGQAAFLATIMSTPLDGTVEYVLLTTPISTGTSHTETALHDDGMSLYAPGLTNILSSSGETVAKAETFVLPAGSYTLTGVYVEAQGAPAALQFTTAVPEPSTWAMMIFGFIGVGFMSYRRKSKDSRFRIA